MARKKKVPEKTEDIGDEAEGWEESLAETDDKDIEAAAARSRDWRDVERLRELKELRSLVDEGEREFEEIFKVEPPPPPPPKLKVAAKKALLAAKAAAAALPKGGKPVPVPVSPKAAPKPQKAAKPPKKAPARKTTSKPAKKKSGLMAKLARKLKLKPKKK